jgi:hypothetical protein
MAPFKDMAVSGKLTNAPEGVEDPRSQNTTEL